MPPKIVVDVQSLPSSTVDELSDDDAIRDTEAPQSPVEGPIELTVFERIASSGT